MRKAIKNVEFKANGRVYFFNADAIDCSGFIVTIFFPYTDDMKRDFIENGISFTYSYNEENLEVRLELKDFLGVRF